MNKQKSEVLSLNIGGTHELMTTKKVLCEGVAKGSKLAELFSDHTNNLATVDSKIFLDRDGKTFQILINFLRNSCLIYPKFDTEFDEKLFRAEV